MRARGRAGAATRALVDGDGHRDRRRSGAGGERLLPGYTFTLAGGGTRTVPAVDAGVLFTGLTEAQAAAEAARQGWAYRVVARDGHDLLVTQDYSPARVGVSVTNGKVDKATFG